MSLSKKLKESKAFQEYLKGHRVLLADSSSSRKSVRKLCTEMGMPADKIEVVDSYSDAMDKFKSVKPTIVFADMELTGKPGIELLAPLKESVASPIGRYFFLLTGDNSASVASLVAGGDIDGLVVKPFNFATLEESVCQVFMDKAQPSDYLKTVDSARIAISEGQFENALSLLAKAKELDNAPASACQLEADVYLKTNNIDGAIGSFEEGLGYNERHFNCLNGLFQLRFTRKEISEAYELLKRILQNFPPDPRQIPNYIWLIVSHKKYEDIEVIAKGFSEVDRNAISDEVARSLSAGLVVCGKHCLKLDKKSQAISCFKDAERLSLGRAVIVGKIVQSLLDVGDQDHADEFLNRASDKVKDSPEVLMAIMNFEFKNKCFDRALEHAELLLKSGIKEKSIYRVVIESSIELGRRKTLVEDLIDQAEALFPEIREEYAAILEEKYSD